MQSQDPVASAYIKALNERIDEMLVEYCRRYEISGKSDDSIFFMRKGLMAAREKFKTIQREYNRKSLQP